MSKKDELSGDCMKNYLETDSAEFSVTDKGQNHALL